MQRNQSENARQGARYDGIDEIEPSFAGAGVRVDDPERRRLFGHVGGDLDQDQVFQHIGVVAGVKGVAVAEHRRIRKACRRGGKGRQFTSSRRWRVVQCEEAEAVVGFELGADDLGQ